MSIIQFIDNSYLWDEMSLWEFLEEGNIPSDWIQFFLNNQEQLYLISEALKIENPSKIFPSINKVFRSFINVEKIKVVFLGMDPYHNGSAVGYCFSVLPGNTINPSLKNIYKELNQEGYKVKEDGVLTHWAEQGCFMLNTALTVMKGNAGSHIGHWCNFTENVVKYVSEKGGKLVWILMGAEAQKVKCFIPDTQHYIMTSHPSPFSAHRATKVAPSFLGSGVFRETNEYLEANGKTGINW